MKSIVGTGLLALAALSGALAQDSNTWPMQVRLAYAGPLGMTISWNTFSPLSNPTVKYGLDPHSLDQTVSSNVSITYPTSLTWNNHVGLQGLRADTVYWYQPQPCNSSSPVYSFKTSRPAGDNTPHSVAIAVDLGLMGPDGLTTHVGNGAANPLGPNDLNTIQSLVQNNGTYDFLAHVGDIAYADYWLKEEIQGFLPNTTIADGAKVYEKLLNEFYDEMTPITAFVPYMVAPGNHEANCDNGGTTNPATNVSYDVSICMPGQTNFTGYINHFRMPSPESQGTGNFWYSFDNGMVHYVVFDTETDIGDGRTAPDEPGGPEQEDAGPFGKMMNSQLQWMESDLKAVDRSKTPWVVALGHRPFYGSAPNDPSDLCNDCRLSIEPLFIKYGVDIVYSGHVHNVERLNPIANTVPDPSGLNNPSAPWYLRNGAAGHYDGLDPLVLPVVNYSNYANDTEYSWTRLTFHNCTHVTNEFVASKDGSVLDSATLFKDRTCSASSSTNGTSPPSPSGSGSSSAPTTSSTLLPLNTSGSNKAWGPFYGTSSIAASLFAVCAVALVV